MDRHETVTFGYVHNGTLRQEFHTSILAAMYYDAAHDRHILGEVSAAGPYIADNRNKMGQRFLDQGGDWLFELDVDIDFPPELVYHLLEVADAETRPVVGVCYFTHLEADGGKHWLPVWMENGEHGELSVVRQLEIGEIKELTSTGAGCTFIHRSALERMLEVYGPDGEGDPWPWWGHDIVDGKRCGEDVTFCLRARRLGIPIHGLTLPVTHIKTARVGWREFVEQSDIEAWRAEKAV